MIQTLNFNAIRTKIKGAAAAVIFLLTVMPGYGQQKLTRQEYIDRYKETAMEAMRTHGIPASITLAQGCLESGDGNSDLAVKAKPLRHQVSQRLEGTDILQKGRRPGEILLPQIPQPGRVLQGPLRLPTLQGPLRIPV